MYCKQCGAKIQEGSKFCPSCGQVQAAAVTAVPGTGSLGGSGQSSASVIGAVGIGISALTIISFFLPWVNLPSFVSLAGISDSPNLLSWLRVGLAETQSDYVGEFFAYLLMTILAILAAIFHGKALVENLKGVKQGPTMLDSGIIYGGAMTLIVVVINAIMVAAGNADLSDATFGIFGGELSLGSGAVLAGLLSIGGFIVAHLDTTAKHTTTQPKDIVICPSCGTTYTKLTAATPCPVCHRLPGEGGAPAKLAPVPKTENVTCPFCKRVYPKGTVYCEDCKAQIGTPKTAQAKFCRVCGQKLQDTDKFCPGCGAKCG